jgi:signal transduction histidine kinase
MRQRIDQQLNKSLDLNRVLSSALNWAIALTNADGGSIGLFEQVEDEAPFLRLMVFRGAEEAAELRTVSVGHVVVQQVLRDGRSVLTHHVAETESIDGTPATVQLVVPIHQNGEISGIITLESQSVQGISQEDVAFVERLADRAAVAIKNAQLYEQIHAANSAKSEFVSLVAHELRVPMTSIKGYADLMASGMAGTLNDQQKQFLEVIRRNLQRMSTLISDLSDINRIESGRMNFNNKIFNLYDIVFDVTESLSERIEARKQTLDVQVDETIPEVFADPTRITQVLTNLVSNANKYTPEGGHIVVQATYNDRAALVTVQDNGIGISEENQKKLFTQFFRAEDQSVREQPGWGLGLSIVRKMVEAQGGEIQYQSELGKGSTFTFTVPLMQASAAEQ